MCQEQAIFKHDVPMTKEQFDLKLFKELCDAHCHPHDDIDNLAMIPKLQTGHITIMGVRQDDWERVSQTTKECNKEMDNKCIPCFVCLFVKGIHPWFSHFVSTPEKSGLTSKEYYASILQSSDSKQLEEMIQALPEPSSYDTWYHRLRQRLEQHPEALVGEVGVDRSARLLPGGAIDWHGKKPTQVQTSIEHQLAILDIQCQLARELNRGVSLHCVQGQGHLFDHLKKQSTQFSGRKLRQLKEKPNMLRVCLHSFGGSPATVTQFIELKGFEIYVSFSVAINAQHLPPHKMQALICSVPEDRLLIESDLNTPKGIDVCMIDIVKIVAEARNLTIAQVIEITNRNWKRFVNLQ
ncbi:Cut9-interacting protein scn1 [Choanephora cucurbitarum]|uniref:Cut9-interacting protein scn1 n=1 Tax=Choanephora cucurbitarum TaxID=101091 RepID=A0A1C7NHT0_9FUNG|nr:Cut9-interacting protein scn1 [Choanephora cucurbitarum]